MNHDFIPQRSDYGDRALHREELSENPMESFKAWFEEAVAADIPEANAVCLCTQDDEGYPDARMVLLKGFDAHSLHFYTNYESRKGKQLEASGRAAMVFWWEPLKRQVRFSGKVRRLEPELSDEYFASRPRESQLGAWASLQSEVLPDRSVLTRRLQEMEERFGEKVPRPDYWGGYRLSPRRIEFWQGRSSRLHDRFVYSLASDEGPWRLDRLMP